MGTLGPRVRGQVFWKGFLKEVVLCARIRESSAWLELQVRDVV